MAGAETISQFQAAAASVFDQLRGSTNTANARIHFVGIIPQGGSAAPNISLWNEGLKTAVGFLQISDAKVYYHDPAGIGLVVSSVDYDAVPNPFVHLNISGRNKLINWVYGWLSACWAAAGGVNVGQWLGQTPGALSGGNVARASEQSSGGLSERR